MTNVLYEISLMVTNCCPDGNSVSGVIRTTVDEWRNFREWLMAFGSVCVVFVAVFSPWIRSLFKARIKLLISSRAPHYMYDDPNGAWQNTDGGEACGKIWLEAYNKSRWIDAVFCRVVLEDVFVRYCVGNNNSFRRNFNMHPCCLTWSGLVPPKNSYLQISTQTSEYALLALIRARVVSVQNTAQNSEVENPPAQGVVPVIEITSARGHYVVDGDFQDVILKVRVTGRTVRSRIVYYNISWEGKTVMQLKQGADKFLLCKEISRAQYSALTGEQVK